MAVIVMGSLFTKVREFAKSSLLQPATAFRVLKGITIGAYIALMKLKRFLVILEVPVKLAKREAMAAKMVKFREMAVSDSIEPWIDLAKERGMTEHPVFQNLLKGFERAKAGTITEEELQAAMQAFIDVCSANATSERPRL